MRCQMIVHMAVLALPAIVLAVAVSQEVARAAAETPIPSSCYLRFCLSPWVFRFLCWQRDLFRNQKSFTQRRKGAKTQTLARILLCLRPFASLREPPAQKARFSILVTQIETAKGTDFEIWASFNIRPRQNPEYPE